MARGKWEAFAGISAVHLASTVKGVPGLRELSKPLLMPALLAAWSATAPTSPSDSAASGGADARFGRTDRADRTDARLVAGALLASCAGDTLLLGDGPLFLAGMGAFGTAHLCWIARFQRELRAFAASEPAAPEPEHDPGTGSSIGSGSGTRTGRAGRFLARVGRVAGAPPRRRRRAGAVCAGYAAAWAGVTAALWPGLDPELRLPVAGYAALLCGTAAVSALVGRRAGLGGLLFLISDGMIAGKLAHWPELPATDFWIMATYLLAQYLLTTGVTPGELPAAVATALGDGISEARLRSE